jgi:hypothetical protein
MTDTPQLNPGDVLHEASTGYHWHVMEVSRDPDRGWGYWCFSTPGAYNRTWRDADLAHRLTVARRATPDDPPPTLLGLLTIDSELKNWKP